MVKFITLSNIWFVFLRQYFIFWALKYKFCPVKVTQLVAIKDISGRVEVRTSDYLLLHIYSV
jgi:hypothetical protein